MYISERIMVKRAKITPINYMKVEYFEMYEVGPEDLKQMREKKCLIDFKHDPHIDLKKAFDGLKFHMAHLTKQAPHSELEDYYDNGGIHPVILEMIVTSFSIGGSGDHAGVTITGVRQLDNGKVLNINTPFTKYQNEHEQYIYGIDLEEAVRKCVEEVVHYIDGKCAPIEPDEEYEQLSISFPVVDHSNLTDDTDSWIEDEQF